MTLRTRPLLALALLVALGTFLAARADDGTPAVPPPPPAPAAPSPPPPKAPEPPPPFSVERLKSHVAFLASADLAGRGAIDDRVRAARWVAARLEEAGAKPVPGQEGFLLPFEGDGFPGTNVAGFIAGTTDEYVIASAHYDGLGKKEGVLHPGADDDASGVAALIEVTRALAAGKPLRRSVLVVAFDLGQDRCRGSTAFAEKPPIPLERCAASTTADLLGRSMGDAIPGLLLVMGEERADALGSAVSTLGEPKGLLVRRLGLDFHALGWSDAVPFQQKRVPSLLLTSGASRNHGKPADTADKLEWNDLAARGAAWLSVVRAIADAPERPTWKEEFAPTLAEMEHLLDLVRRGVEKPEALAIPESARPLGKAFLAQLEGVVARKTVKPRERDSMRFMALTMFGYLAGPPGR